MISHAMSINPKKKIGLFKFHELLRDKRKQLSRQKDHQKAYLRTNRKTLKRSCCHKKHRLQANYEDMACSVL
jgi:hypothetical protein